MMHHTPIHLNAIGIGLRQPHYKSIRHERPNLDFLEVHAENFFHAGGASIAVLEDLRQDYAISLHGVGLGLGSPMPLDLSHLKKLKALVDRIEPIFVSEHLSWGHSHTQHFNDLLPIAWTHETLNLLTERIEQLQNYLQRTVFIENLSYYVQFRKQDYTEFEFIATLCQRTGCKVLLDINNIYVNSENFKMSPHDHLKYLQSHMIGEIHLAGHSHTEHGLLDTHSTPISQDVWQLYQKTIAHIGAKPTLIEWDLDLPSLQTLLNEAEQAKRYLNDASILPSVEVLS